MRLYRDKIMARTVYRVPFKSDESSKLANETENGQILLTRRVVSLYFRVLGGVLGGSFANERLRQPIGP
jgi:hypothetical protein